MTDPFLHITHSAAKRLLVIKAKQEDPVNAFLRITVEGGGCSGFQYQMDFDTHQTEDDLDVEYEGAKVVTDPVSLEFLKGVTLDYVDVVGSAAFKIINPNATANCGCGNSFSV
jgi:iron-sulfur cluster insertion protein